MTYSSVEELEAAAAEHEKNHQIIMGSFPSKPGADDFEMANRAQRELELAKDKRELAARVRAEA